MNQQEISKMGEEPRDVYEERLHQQNLVNNNVNSNTFNVQSDEYIPRIKSMFTISDIWKMTEKLTCFYGFIAKPWN